eukprot:6012545-Amphidinium_carterae.1
MQTSAQIQQLYNPPCKVRPQFQLLPLMASQAVLLAWRSKTENKKSTEQETGSGICREERDRRVQHGL